MGNRDGLPSLVVVSFGTGVGDLSRKGRRLGHAMLADSWEILKVWYSYFRFSENKTINVFPIDYIVQLSKLTSQ